MECLNVSKSQGMSWHTNLWKSDTNCNNISNLSIKHDMSWCSNSSILNDTSKLQNLLLLLWWHILSWYRSSRHAELSVSLYIISWHKMSWHEVSRHTVEHGISWHVIIITKSGMWWWTKLWSRISRHAKVVEIVAESNTHTKSWKVVTQNVETQQTC